MRIQHNVDTVCDVSRRVHFFGVVRVIEELRFDDGGMISRWLLDDITLNTVIPGVNVWCVCVLLCAVLKILVISQSVI